LKGVSRSKNFWGECPHSSPKGLRVMRGKKIRTKTGKFGEREKETSRRV